MPQLPLLAPAPGGSAPHQLTESADGAQPLQPISEQQLEANSFEQALLESLDDEALSEFPWFSMLQQQQADTFLMLTAGKCLPHMERGSGKVLPLQTVAVPAEIQLQMFQEGTLKSKMSTEATPQLILEKLSIPTEGGDFLYPSRSAEQLLQGLDVRAVGNMLVQPATIGGQSIDPGLSVRPSMPTLSIDVPVSHPGWDKAVAHRIQWLIGQNVQEAELKLTPPNLGPLEIRISLQNDQASVSFVSPQALTREAIELAMPRLKEMLGEVNLNLTHVDVGHREADNSHAQQSGSGNPYHHTQGRPDAQIDSQERTLPTFVSRGLVDDYV